MENTKEDMTENSRPKGSALRYAPYIACAAIAAALFLFVAMPMLANTGTGTVTNTSTPSTGLFSQAASAPQASAPSTANTEQGSLKAFRMSVQIPCSGHTPLILGEVGKMPGVVSIKNSGGWNSFEVTYDGTKTSKETILGSDLFKPYPATVL